MWSFLFKHCSWFNVLLIFPFLSEKETWKTETESLKVEKKKLEDQIQQDTIKVKEYNVSRLHLIPV